MSKTSAMDCIRPGDLTSGALLYEGNYDEWLARIPAILRGKGVWIPSHFPESLKWLPYEGAVRACTTLCSQIGPHIVLRIGDEATSEPYELFQLATTLAKPFRVTDLSPELRTQIYEYSLALEDTELISGNEHPALPPLLQASQQMRIEASAIYFAMKQFRFGITTGRRSPLHLQTIETLVQPWVDNVVRDQMKNLRKVSIYRRYRRGNTSGSLKSQQVDLTFSKAEGLKMSFADRKALYPSTAAARQKLETAIKVADLGGKALSAQGGAIILALLSQPRVWDIGEGFDYQD